MLGLDRFDEKRGEPGVVHAQSFAVFVKRGAFRQDFDDFLLGDEAEIRTSVARRGILRPFETPPRSA